jgi:hypothetical protein
MVAPSSNSRRRMIWLAALVAPAAAVQLVRVFQGEGPQAAPAATAAPGIELPSEPVKAPLTNSQRLALARLRGYIPAEQLSSPMDYTEPQPVPVEAPAPAITPESPRETIDPLAGLTVSAILGHEATACAIIGHKLRRAGDEIAAGWRVQHIDSRLRTVEVVNSAGQTVIMSPPSR